MWEAQLYLHLVGVPNLLWGSIHLLYKRDYVLTTFFALLGRSSNDENESNENVAKKWICVLSSRLFGLTQFAKCG